MVGSLFLLAVAVALILVAALRLCEVVRVLGITRMIPGIPETMRSGTQLRLSAVMKNSLLSNSLWSVLRYTGAFGLFELNWNSTFSCPDGVLKIENQLKYQSVTLHWPVIQCVFTPNSKL